MELSLEVEALAIIKKIKILNEQKAREALLVSVGAKRGDKIYWLTNHKESIEQYIKELEMYVPIKTENNGKNNCYEQEIYFYNTQLMNDQEEEWIRKAIMGNTLNTKILGWLYGYPECCINAYIQKPTGIMGKHTEHHWCKKDCGESIKMEQDYERIIRKYLS